MRFNSRGDLHLGFFVLLVLIIGLRFQYLVLNWRFALIKCFPAVNVLDCFSVVALLQMNLRQREQRSHFELTWNGLLRHYVFKRRECIFVLPVVVIDEAVKVIQHGTLIAVHRILLGFHLLEDFDGFGGVPLLVRSILCPRQLLVYRGAQGRHFTGFLVTGLGFLGSGVAGNQYGR